MDLLERIAEVVRIAEQLRDVELKRKLTDVRIECLELAQENATLRERVYQLENVTTSGEGMVFRDNVYWMTRDDGAEEGPLCPKCWGGERKRIPMLDETHWVCVVCKTGIVKEGRNQTEHLVPPRESIR